MSTLQTTTTNGQNKRTHETKITVENTVDGIGTFYIVSRKETQWQVDTQRIWKQHKEAFNGEWFRSGHLVVKYDDNYIEVNDWLNDVIISSGEYINTVEVETI